MRNVALLGSDFAGRVVSVGCGVCGHGRSQHLVPLPSGDLRFAGARLQLVRNQVARQPAAALELLAEDGVFCLMHRASDGRV